MIRCLKGTYYYQKRGDVRLRRFIEFHGDKPSAEEPDSPSCSTLFFVDLFIHLQ